MAETFEAVKRALAGYIRLQRNAHPIFADTEASIVIQVYNALIQEQVTGRYVRPKLEHSQLVLRQLQVGSGQLGIFLYTIDPEAAIHVANQEAADLEIKESLLQIEAWCKGFAYALKSTVSRE